MLVEEVMDDNGESVTIIVTLEKEEYKLLEKISAKLGMDMSPWVEFVLSSKIRGGGPCGRL